MRSKNALTTSRVAYHISKAAGDKILKQEKEINLEPASKGSQVAADSEDEADFEDSGADSSSGDVGKLSSCHQPAGKHNHKSIYIIHNT